MAKINLAKYGIKGVKEILYNPTYEVLYNEETKPELEGFDKGQVTELGAINVMTGIYTGRSPKDKYIVYDKTSKVGAPGEVWWTTPEYPNDNHPMTEKVWKTVKKLAQKQHEGPLHHGGRLAGPFRDQHVHPSEEPEGVRPGA